MAATPTRKQLPSASWLIEYWISQIRQVVLRCLVCLGLLIRCTAVHGTVTNCLCVVTAIELSPGGITSLVKRGKEQTPAVWLNGIHNFRSDPSASFLLYIHVQHKPKQTTMLLPFPVLQFASSSLQASLPCSLHPIYLCLFITEHKLPQ